MKVDIFWENLSLQKQKELRAEGYSPHIEPLFTILTRNIEPVEIIDLDKLRSIQKDFVEPSESKNKS